jgi:hypothetical protein
MSININPGSGGITINPGVGPAPGGGGGGFTIDPGVGPAPGGGSGGGGFTIDPGVGPAPGGSGGSGGSSGGPAPGGGSGGSGGNTGGPITGGGIIVSEICFPANTPIKTDQGLIAIHKIIPHVHTIRNNHVVAITATTALDEYLVLIKKNALKPNYPSHDTIISKKHKVYYEGTMYEASYFLDKFENVQKVKYNGELLYNVLLKNYSYMVVNNLICETLHPENNVAKIYQNVKPTCSMQNKMIQC